jgi:hypothetical protein
MISHEDCIAMCGLDAKQVAAIAEHEHVPEVAATALANYLLHKIGGEKEILDMIVDDIKTSLDENRLAHATELFMALRHYVNHHPQAIQARTH